MHGVMDLMHKTANPKTYPCKLCQITFSGATMNKLWKQYVAGLDIPTVFLHKNEFEQSVSNINIKYPAVLLKTGTSFKTLLSAEDFSKIRDLGDLMRVLNERLPHASRK